MTSTLEIASASAPFVEKTPLERYVAPEKPSLIGLSRAELGRRAGRDRRAGSAAQDARAAALALDLFPRLDSFDAMTSVSKELRASAWRSASRWRGPKSWPSRSRSTARANGCCGCRAKTQGERPHEVECVYIPDTERGTLVRVEPGRLHAHLHVLPHRHAAAGAQSHRRRNRRPGDGGARPLGDWPGGTRPPTASSQRASAASPMS